MADAPIAVADTTETTQEQLLAAFRGMSTTQQTKNLQQMQRKGTNVDHTNHRFWDKQPVTQFMDDVVGSVNEPIDPVKTVAEIRQEPYNMPAGFVWDTIDMTVPTQVDEVYTLLYENYVEDDDEMFRCGYMLCYAML
jgi:glycylpeptide N-tetradecanoyltransferase